MQGRQLTPVLAFIRDLLPHKPVSLETGLQSLLWSSLIVGIQFPTFSKHADVTLKVTEIIFTTATWMRPGTSDDLGTHTPFMGYTGASPDPDSKPKWTAIDLLLVNPLETQVQQQPVWSSERTQVSSHATSQQSDNDHELATAGSTTSQMRPTYQCSG